MLRAIILVLLPRTLIGWAVLLGVLAFTPMILTALAGKILEFLAPAANASIALSYHQALLTLQLFTELISSVRLF